MTSVMHVFSITAGVDISPAFGSLSGATVLTLSGSADVDGVDSPDLSSVAVDIGGIPCDIDTYARTWLGCSPSYLLPCSSPAGPLHPVGTFNSSSSCCRSRAVSNSSLSCVTRSYPSAQEGLDSPPLTVTVTLNNTHYKLNRTFMYSWDSTPQVSAQSMTNQSMCPVEKVISKAAEATSCN